MAEQQGDPPSELPANAAWFVNRERHRQTMSTLYEQELAAGRPTFLAVCGPDGAGRFSAIVKWFRDTPGRFPDGQIHVRLGGPQRDEIAAVGAKLGEVLSALGLPSKDQPATAEERRKALLNLSAGKRLLLVLENVTSTGQVDWFPLATPGATVAVTTTRLLAPGLIGRGYRPVEIDGLAMPHRLDLFRQLLGPKAAALAPEQLATVARSVGGLPLPLRVVGAQLAASRRVAKVLARIEEQGLAAVAAEGRDEVQASFDLTYSGLGELQVAYRRLGLHPGLELDLAAATALLGEDAEELLAELVDLALLTEQDGRYRLDELVWRDAAARALAEEGFRELGQVLGWIIEHYLHGAVTRDKVLSDRPRSGPLFTELAPARVSRAEALAWLSGHRDALRGTVRLAEQHGFDAAAWQLCEALWGLYHLHGHYDDWIETHQLGLAAARRLGVDAAIMRMAGQLGSAHFAVGELAAADECFAEQHEAAARYGDGSGQQSALEWRGKIAAKRGDAEEAAAWFEKSWRATETLVPEPARPRTYAILRLQRARLLRSTGRPAEAVELLLAAAAHFAGTAETDNQAKVAMELGLARRALGEPATAELRRATELFRADGSLRSLLAVLRELEPDSQEIVQLEISLGLRPAG
ncbi:NB-ARC domain-containing protein [Crossiella sp. CA-258035]|uniref:NB-ARC domain-containing protein n=1 Tax=Crossiella sp. CA-258035 TaxID=2981138 RepID=UPI0024BCCF0A|nr:NB-ARC domain-containing protein [Crossiella sp. CA-258035]WHT19174.1 NB-ARC domain-containing protein [Crossiella sp. CA-258035]